METGCFSAAEDVDAEFVGAAEDLLNVAIVDVPISKSTQSSGELGPAIRYVFDTVGVVVHDLHVQGDGEGEGQRHPVVDGQGGQDTQQLELVQRFQGARLEPRHVRLRVCGEGSVFRIECFRNGYAEELLLHAAVVDAVFPLSMTYSDFERPDQLTSPSTPELVHCVRQGAVSPYFEDEVVFEEFTPEAG